MVLWCNTKGCFYFEIRGKDVVMFVGADGGCSGTRVGSAVSNRVANKRQTPNTSLYEPLC